MIYCRISLDLLGLHSKLHHQDDKVLQSAKYKKYVSSRLLLT